jgi:hypothetical protein
MEKGVDSPLFTTDKNTPICPVCIMNGQQEKLTLTDWDGDGISWYEGYLFCNWCKNVFVAHYLLKPAFVSLEMQKELHFKKVEKGEKTRAAKG